MARKAVRAAAFLVAGATALSCSPRARGPTTPRAGALACPSSLSAAVPSDATAWLFVRPRAIYNHPRLGSVLVRSFDEAGERALIRRVERTGYDVRTLDRALIVWRPTGPLYLAGGSFDTARVTDMFWSRLLPPRRRARDGHANERLEGSLGPGLAALLLVPACGLAAYTEGRDPRGVDRVLTARGGRDPDELLRWRARAVPEALARADGTALARDVRAIEVRAIDGPAGLRVTLLLEGPLPDDAGDRLRRAVAAVAESPLGEIAGASQWLTPDRLTIARTPVALQASVELPWGALVALADAMRGQVGGPSVD